VCCIATTITDASCAAPFSAPRVPGSRSIVVLPVEKHFIKYFAMPSPGECMDRHSFRRDFTTTYLAEIRSILDEMEDTLLDQMDDLAGMFFDARERGATIFICGNGGSGSTASHFVSDLGKGTLNEHFPRFRALALTDNIPLMLAWGNDSSYGDIFVEQLKNLMLEGDILVGISGSGNSENVVRAFEWANDNGGITVGLSAYSPENRMMKCAQFNIHVPTFYMQRAEDIHLLLEHLLTSLIREEQWALDEEAGRERGGDGC